MSVHTLFTRRFPQLLYCSSHASRIYIRASTHALQRPATGTITTMAKDKNVNTLKCPKGTRDWAGPDKVLLNDILNRIRAVFLSKRVPELDTPVFELQEVLKGKYGEDSKLIYDIADQGGELLSLRYDLTVPFARWLSMNPNLREYKRFAVGKVYRRDQPAVKKGRMREFWQCDVDFAGASGVMVSDSRIISIISEVFEALEWGDGFTIKLNDRRILDGLFEVCGVPAEKIRSISSAVDKLDKMPWSEVKKEMVELKGLEEPVADRIWEYVQLKGGKGDSQSAVDLLTQLKSDEKLMANEKAKTGITEFETLLEYLDAMDALRNVSVDLSLARGLDYYTGVIYEVITEGSRPTLPTEGDTKAKDDKKTAKKAKKVADEDEDRSDDPTVGVGSVAAGGRYDNLVSRFNDKANVPCVGVSFGVDRIFSVIQSRIAAGQSFSYLTSNAIDVYVLALGGKDFNSMKERLIVVRTLERAGFTVGFSPDTKPRTDKQFKEVEKLGAAISVILGEDEVKSGKLKVKVNGLMDENDPRKTGITIERGELVNEVGKTLKELNSANGAAGVEGLEEGVKKL